MSRDQIEEMAVTTCSLYRRYLDKKCGGNSDCDFNCHHYTRCENLYNAGYRKQSENTVEVVRCKECRNCEKVPSILGTVLYCNEWCKDVAEDTFCSFGAKMKGGAE